MQPSGKSHLLIMFSVVSITLTAEDPHGNQDEDSTTTRHTLESDNQGGADAQVPEVRFPEVSTTMKDIIGVYRRHITEHTPRR